MVKPPWKTVWRFLKKLKIKQLYDRAIPLLGVSGQNCNSKRYMHPCVVAALFTIAKTWEEQKRPSIDERIKKMRCSDTMAYYSAIAENDAFAICSNKDGPIGHYAKRSKSDREKQIVYDATYVWNLKHTVN